MNSFYTFPMREELTRAISDLGFETPTPIQEKVIPQLLSEPIDIIGLAQTGTGKTAAYGLPLLHHVDTSLRHIQGLVLSPTRELCMQIQEELSKYGTHMPGLKIVAVYGGVPISGQLRDVKNNPHIIVATPGRLIDLLDRRALTFEKLKFVVLDEADEMLNMGFREDIELILKNTPEREYTWLFSATMSNEVRGIAKNFMSDWKEFSVSAPNTTNENIDHQYFVAQHHNRFETLRRLLDFTPGIYGIIFTRTKQDAQDVSEKLMKMGYSVSPLHGDMDQKMRTKVMERFKNRSLQAIVATDVAARGIDVNDITHVINYELPDDPEVYTHRSGRTARAGKSGICMSIVSPKQIGAIRQIERLVKQKFHKSDIPDGADVIRKRIVFYLDQITHAEPKSDFAKLYLESIHEQFASLDKDVLIKKLIWLQLHDTIEAYQNADDLNAGYDGASKGKGGATSNRSSTKSTRLYINLGEKDGLTAQKLVHFITESTDIDSKVIERVTVRDLSSFFNVPGDAVEYVMENLSSKKFKTRSVRLEVADQRPGEGERPSSRRTTGKYEDGDSREHSRSSGRDRQSSSARFTGDVKTYDKKESNYRGKKKY